MKSILFDNGDLTEVWTKHNLGTDTFYITVEGKGFRYSTTSATSNIQTLDTGKYISVSGTLFVGGYGELIVLTIDEYNTILNGDAGAGGVVNEPLRVAFIGDSITAFGYDTSAPPLVAHDIRGYASHAMANSGGRLLLGNVLGKPGFTSTQILPLIDAFLKTCTEKVVVFFAGANDIMGGAMTVDALHSNIMQAAAMITSSGKLPVLATILPRSDAPSAAERNLREGVNKRLREGREAGGYILIDWSHVYQKADGTIPVSLAYDGVHPYIAAETMGKLLVKELDRLMPAEVSPDTWAYTNQTGWFSNGGLSGTGGTKDSATTGVVATGWAAQCQGTGSAMTCSKVASTDDDPQDWQQLVVTAGAAIAYGSIQQQITAQAGKVRFAAEVEVESSNGGLCGAQLVLRSYSGTSPVFTHLAPIDTSITYPNGVRRLFLCTPEMNLTLADASNAFLSVAVVVSANKSATLRVRRIGWI